MADYSKTTFYEIVCVDGRVPTKYVGFTTNWSKRANRHKVNFSLTMNVQYADMEKHGGYENWKIKELQVRDCKSREAAIEFIATNYHDYTREMENEFRCELCDYDCAYKSGMNAHYKTAKHISRTKNPNAAKPETAAERVNGMIEGTEVLEPAPEGFITIADRDRQVATYQATILELLTCITSVEENNNSLYKKTRIYERKLYENKMRMDIISHCLKDDISQFCASKSGRPGYLDDVESDDEAKVGAKA